MGQGSVNETKIHQGTSRHSLRCELVVPADPQLAFTVFTERLSEWWVREYTWSGPDALADIGFEARTGGMAYEIGPHGFRSDWGRLLVFEPPRRLVLAWQIGPDRAPVPDPTRASEVRVDFEPENTDTRVTVDHHAFDRHGTAAEGYRDALATGWRELLSRYADTVRAARAD